MSQTNRCDWRVVPPARDLAGRGAAVRGQKQVVAGSTSSETFPHNAVLCGLSMLLAYNLGNGWARWRRFRSR